MSIKIEKISFGPYDSGTLKQIISILEESNIEVRIGESSEALKYARRQPSAMIGPHTVSYLYIFLTTNELAALGGRLSNFGIVREEKEP